MSSEIVMEMADMDVSHEDAPETVLVRGVQWRVARGEFWAVGGDLAAATTALLSTAASLNRPVSGVLRVFGRELLQASEAEQVDWRKRIGYVFEGTGRLFGHLTVSENIALPLQYHLDLDDGQLEARVGELLALADLQSVAGLPPSRLNPHVQQRVALARALALPTEVLFLDNPLAGLGVRQARWWLKVLRELQEHAGTASVPATIIATCNDFRGWIDVANRFAMIQGNEFRVLGGREELKSSREPEVQDLFAHAF